MKERCTWIGIWYTGPPYFKRGYALSGKPMKFKFKPEDIGCESYCTYVKKCGEPKRPFICEVIGVTGVYKHNYN